MASSALSWDPAGPALPPFLQAALTVDLVWMTGKYTGALMAPSWAGFMKQAMAARPPLDFPRSSVEAVPFVELAGTNPNAINTALYFATQDAKKRHQDHTFVTFDQPLYMKAVKIVTADPALRGVHLRLGGFQLTMTFLGAICHCRAALRKRHACLHVHG
ncbi:Type III pantothenate kinase [Frankliniella fusca]|uniref:Type III pantothenate kinase n=1 Tax=Frankliniella fusca TaxID=407009 RepID=A0AAE1LS11_9NEOP|nr:Type III pantothenate kinase [Frankliniella fusca]